MAKIIVHHDTDPSIGIELEEVLPGTPGRARGWHGKCTECGWPMHCWIQASAVDAARRHVDNHDAVLVGGDTDALVRG